MLMHVNVTLLLCAHDVGNNVQTIKLIQHHNAKSLILVYTYKVTIWQLFVTLRITAFVNNIKHCIFFSAIAELCLATLLIISTIENTVLNI